MKVLPPVYPKAEPVRLAFAPGEPVPLFRGKVEIVLPVEAAAGAAGRAGALVVEVRFQPCDDRRCLGPERAIIEVPIRIDSPPRAAAGSSGCGPPDGGPGA